jgi:transporter family protein
MNASAFSSWQFWAVLSAVFAALTAIFAKVGVENVNSDLATFIRTIVVICILGLIVYATRQFQNPSEISGRTYLFLLLSGLGTGRVMAVLFPRAETRQRGASGADR